MPVSRTTRSERVAALLRRAIQNGNYLSGERLVEWALAQQMGVSQNTVRDALWMLEQEGWVVKKARRGVYVRAFHADDAEEVYTLRAAIEGLALGWAMNAITPRDIKRLSHLLSQARKAAHMGDAHEVIEILLDFHRTLARLSGRLQTAELLERLLNQAHLLETIRHLRAPRNPQQQIAHIVAYEKLLQTIETRDVEAAREALHRLLMADCAAVSPLLEAPADSRS